MILDAERYLKKRQKNLLAKYRLKKRTEKVLEMVKKYKCNRLRLLDIGAADGAMLSALNSELNLQKAVGIEPNGELIKAQKDKEIELIEGEGEDLPFQNNQFDVVVLAAVIEHVKDGIKVIKESYRVLDKDGILVLITVVPFWDKLVEILRIRPRGTHIHFQRFSLKSLRTIFKKHGLSVLEARKFALISSGLLPFEKAIEDILYKLRLTMFMSYELVVGRK